jgi:hypothetical protein
MSVLGMNNPQAKELFFLRFQLEKAVKTFPIPSQNFSCGV